MAVVIHPRGGEEERHCCLAGPGFRFQRRRPPLPFGVIPLLVQGGGDAGNGDCHQILQAGRLGEPAGSLSAW